MIQKKHCIYYIYFTQNITFNSINFLCSISTKDSSKEFPNLEQKDCNVFQDPDSNNSFFLVILDKYSNYENIYNNIIITKKRQFSNTLTFNISSYSY